MELVAFNYSIKGLFPRDILVHRNTPYVCLLMNADLLNGIICMSQAKLQLNNLFYLFINNLLNSSGSPIRNQ